MKKNKYLDFLKFTVLSLIIATLIMSTSAIYEYKSVSDNVLRLHILANSNMYVDQNVKLIVRNKVLKETSDLFTKSKNIETTLDFAKDNIDLFNDLSNKTLEENGFNYTANAKICKSYFPTKKYGNIILPAGVYNALKIDLGAAKGQNWWCMLFPAICMPSAIKEKSDIEKDTLIKNGSITNCEKTINGKIRFRIVEIMSNIFD